MIMYVLSSPAGRPFPALANTRLQAQQLRVFIQVLGPSLGPPQGHLCVLKSTP